MLHFMDTANSPRKLLASRLAWLKIPQAVWPIRMCTLLYKHSNALVIRAICPFQMR